MLVPLALGVSGISGPLGSAVSRRFWAMGPPATAPPPRQPTPEELAWACTFLCSTRAAAITGAVIHVTGGEWMFG